MRRRNAIVNVFICDFLVGLSGIWATGGVERRGGCIACLQDVERPPHVATGQGEKGVDGRGGDTDVFGLDDVGDAFSEGRKRERGKAEAGAAGEERGVELVSVVGDDAEAGVGGVSVVNVELVLKSSVSEREKERRTFP